MAGRSGTSLKNNYWPEDLLLSILATLPAKSLLRFKCVSKHWQALIINPHFMEQHLEKQQKKDYPQLIFPSRASKPDRTWFWNPWPSSMLKLVMEKEQRPGKETNKRAYNDIFLAVRVFPLYQLVGFGRDQVTKECKIIRLFTPNEENPIHECEVFTLSSDAGASWKGLGEVAYFIRAAQLPVYLNGALHWILDERHANPSEVIVSFDLHTEKFQAISHTSCFSEVSDRSRLHHMELLSLRGSLCLVEGKYDWSSRQLNISIMNQSNGIGEKLFSINRGLMNYRFPLAFPIAELKDGTFLVLRHKKNLEIFDPESQSDSEVLIQHEKSVDYYAYSESLVPLYGVPLVN
ncbi:hypothetical protein QUC31_009683 [Theobroma cacao]